MLHGRWALPIAHCPLGIGHRNGDGHVSEPVAPNSQMGRWAPNSQIGYYTTQGRDNEYKVCAIMTLTISIHYYSERLSMTCIDMIMLIDRLNNLN